MENNPFNLVAGLQALVNLLKDPHIPAGKFCLALGAITIGNFLITANVYLITQYLIPMMKGL